MNRYIIAPSASRDLNEIIDYFANVNVETGERLIAAFQKKCQNLIITNNYFLTITGVPNVT